MARILFATKDNAEGQLSGGISGAATSIPLGAGEGAEFPQPYWGNASSGGTAFVLNDTSALGSVAVGDFIRNVTDGSWAFVTVAGASSITTTRLRGGTDNTWDNNDEWVVNEFVITIEARDADGDVTAREKILIKDRSTDTLTARTRGYDSSSAQAWVTSDWVNLHVTSTIIESIIDALYDLAVQLSTNQTNIATHDTSILALEDSTPYYATDTGSANTHAIAVSPAQTAYVAGQVFRFVAAASNSGAATLNVNALGAKTIKKTSGSTTLADLASGDIWQNQGVEVMYNGTVMILLSPSGATAATNSMTHVGTITAAASAVGASSTAEAAMTPTWTGSNDIGSSKLAAAGAVARFSFFGTYRLDSGVLRIRVKVGGVQFGYFGLNIADLTEQSWHLNFEVVARSVGASGSLLPSGIAGFYASTPLIWVSTVDGGGTAEGAKTTNTTASQAVTITAQFSASDAQHACTLTGGSIEILAAPA